MTKLFSSRARAELFRHLFEKAGEEIHLRELERRTGLAIGSLQQEVKNLVEMDLITSRRDGNRLYYSAKTEHPLFPDLRSIVLKTGGFVQLLQKSLGGLPISVAFVFGSIAKGTEKAASDIDFVLIGSCSLRQLAPILRKIGRVSDRELNPHIYTIDAWNKKVASRDHFVRNLMKADKRFLIGDANVLRKLGS